MGQQTSWGRRFMCQAHVDSLTSISLTKSHQNCPESPRSRKLRPCLAPLFLSISRGGSCCLSEVNRLPSVNVVPPSSKAQLNERRRVDNGIGCACNPKSKSKSESKSSAEGLVSDNVASSRYNLHLMRKLAANRMRCKRIQ